MALTKFNNGWGAEYELSRYADEVLDQYLAPLSSSPRQIVVINSTWYTDEYHAQVDHYLKTHPTDLIILVSMLDQSIARPERFRHLGIPMRCVGYYPGEDEIDFWALAAHRHGSWIVDESLSVPRFDRAFMCLNRKPHEHRVRLVNEILRSGVDYYGMVSLGGDQGRAVRSLSNDQGASDLAPNGGDGVYGITNDIMSLGSPDNWNRHFLNIVTETVYDVSRDWFVSEKIYKPIIGMKPFLVYAPDGGVHWLRQHRFESFVEDFQDIAGLLDLRNPDNLVPFLVRLAEQGPEYWREKYLALRSKIAYNKQRFKSYVQEINDKIKQGISCPI